MRPAPPDRTYCAPTAAALCIAVALLACSGAEPKVFVFDEGQQLGATSFDISRDRFKVVNNLDGKNKPLWNNTRVDLATVVKAHPKACLVDSKSADGGMPKGKKLRAMMVILGHSATHTANRIDISSLTVAGKIVR